MKKSLFILIISATSLLTACTTPPKHHQFDNSTVINSEKDKVWSNIMEWFTENRMQVKTIEKSSGIIYAERTYNLPTTYADCGTHHNTPVAPKISQLNVFVKNISPSKTQVTVNADFASTVTNTWSGLLEPVTCTSKGLLEKSILNAASK